MSEVEEEYGSAREEVEPDDGLEEGGLAAGLLAEDADGGQLDDLLQADVPQLVDEGHQLSQVVEEQLLVVHLLFKV